MMNFEIKKAENVYTFTIPAGLKTLQEAYEFAKDIASGKEYFEDKGQIVDLGPSKEYEYIRVWRDEGNDNRVAPPQEVTEPAENGNFIKPFYDRITWLGMDLQLKGIKAVEEGVPLVLIYEINNEPAQLNVSNDNLLNLTAYQGEVLGYKGPIPVLPPGDLYSEEEALEYMQDYIKEIRKDTAVLTTGKTATAYFGFTKNEEE